MRNLKSLLLAIAVLIPVAASAIEPFEWKWEPAYTGEIHIGYGTTASVHGVNTYSGRTMLGTLQGVRINKYAEAAIGLDAVMLTHYYKGKGLRFAIDSYINMRFYCPVTRDFSPFINLALGGYGSVKPAAKEGSFYCEFGPGVRYRKFNLSLGLNSIGTGSGSCSFFVKTGLYF